MDIARDRLALIRANLERLRLKAEPVQSDALAYQPGRQFDAVAVGGAVAELPQRFLDWVRPGGKLFVIRGQSPVQEAVLYTRADHGWAIESLFETDVPYLHGAEPVQRFAL